MKRDDRLNPHHSGTLTRGKTGSGLGSCGLRLIPDVTFDNCPELDLLIVPGGWGTRIQINDVKFLNRIADRVARTSSPHRCVQVRVFLEEQGY